MASTRRKLLKRSSVREGGLYALEGIMGRCSGHGRGFGGEDIEWTTNGRKRYKRIFVDHAVSDGVVLITCGCCDAATYDERDIPWSELPKRMRAKLARCFKEHLTGGVPVGLQN